MAWEYELRFQPSRKFEKIVICTSEPEGYYVLPDGRAVARHLRYVWCFGCNGFSWAEKLSSLEAIDHWIRTWQDPSSEERNTTLKEHRFRDQKQWMIDWQLRQAYAYRDLLRMRTDAGHCTQCSSTEFVEVPNGVDFMLPDGSGTVMMQQTGTHCFLGPIEEYYTPNGQPIRPEEVPQAPPSANYPFHYELKDYLLLLACLVTSPIWGPIALVVLVVIGVGRASAYICRH